jgi:hypothetical protein
MNGAQIAANSGVGEVAFKVWALLGTGDFDGDGKADALWRNEVNGEVWLWSMNGGIIANSQRVATGVDFATWSFLGTGDFNRDGKIDALWRNNGTGEIWLWFMNGATIAGSQQLTWQGGAALVPVETWTVVAMGDFDNDGMPDILWRNARTGEIWLWRMNGATITASTFVAALPSKDEWTFEASGDFDGDGNLDVILRHSGGDVWLWQMNGATVTASTFLGNVPVATWKSAGSGDYDGDGKSDALWRNTTTGEVWAWFMNGAVIANSLKVTTAPATLSFERMTN